MAGATRPKIYDQTRTNNNPTKKYEYRGIKRRKTHHEPLSDPPKIHPTYNEDKYVLKIPKEAQNLKIKYTKSRTDDNNNSPPTIPFHPKKQHYSQTIETCESSQTIQHKTRQTTIELSKNTQKIHTEEIQIELDERPPVPLINSNNQSRDKNQNSQPISTTIRR